MNLLTYYKATNPNLYSLLVSLLLAVWYNGVAGLLNYYFPNRGPALSITLLLIPLVIFLSDDGDLSELYHVPTLNYPMSTAAAATTMATQAQIKAQQQAASQKQAAIRN